VRELRAVIQRASFVSDAEELSASVLERAISRFDEPANLDVRRTVRREADRAALRALCAAHGWDRHRIAAALEISEATLYRRLKAAGISLRGCSRSHHSQTEPENPQRITGDRSGDARLSHDDTVM
jgi:transcriptional regulator of acetoin/glycerol metabolism